MSGSRFLYHAHATGLSGQITRPFQQTIDVHAASALSPSGGYSSARREGFRFREILSYNAVHTETSGSPNLTTQAHTTVATGTMEGFNLCDVVTADVITGRIASSHPFTGEDPSITPLGCSFQGLRIAGRDIELESNAEEFTRLD